MRLWAHWRTARRSQPQSSPGTIRPAPSVRKTPPVFQQKRHSPLRHRAPAVDRGVRKLDTVVTRGSCVSSKLGVCVDVRCGHDTHCPSTPAALEFVENRYRCSPSGAHMQASREAEPGGASELPGHAMHSFSVPSTNSFAAHSTSIRSALQ